MHVREDCISRAVVRDGGVMCGSRNKWWKKCAWVLNFDEGLPKYRLFPYSCGKYDLVKCWDIYMGVIKSNKNTYLLSNYNIAI